MKQQKKKKNWEQPVIRQKVFVSSAIEEKTSHEHKNANKHFYQRSNLPEVASDVLLAQNVQKSNLLDDFCHIQINHHWEYFCFKFPELKFWSV